MMTVGIRHKSNPTNRLMDTNTAAMNKNTITANAIIRPYPPSSLPP